MALSDSVCIPVSVSICNQTPDLVPDPAPVSNPEGATMSTTVTEGAIVPVSVIDPGKILVLVPVAGPDPPHGTQRHSLGSDGFLTVPWTLLNLLAPPWMSGATSLRGGNVRNSLQDFEFSFAFLSVRLT